MPCGQELEPTLCTVSPFSECCLISKGQASKPLASKHVFWALTAPLAFLWLRPPSLPAAPSAATDHLSHLPHRSSLSTLSCSGLCVYCSVCHSHKLISLRPWYTNVTAKHTQQSVIGSEHSTVPSLALLGPRGTLISEWRHTHVAFTSDSGPSTSL